MLYSVSAAALAAAGATTATAQSLPEGYSLTVQGGVAMSNDAWADKVGSGGPFSGSGGSGYSNTDTTTYGYLGAISLERRVNSQRDYTFGATIAGEMANSRTFSSGYFFASGFSNSGYVSGAYASGYSTAFDVGDSFSFQALDFELGHRPASSNDVDVRMFAGLRGMRSVSSDHMTMDKIGATSGGNGYSGYTGTMNYTSTFWGIGPRVGAGFSSRSPGSNFGFSGKVGAAAMFGQRTDEGSGSATVYGNSGGYYSYPSSGGPFGSGGSGYSETNDKTVYSLDIDLGVDYYLNDASKVTVGYKAQQMWNVDYWSDEDNDSPYAGPRLVQGVYLGYTTSF